MSCALYVLGSLVRHAKRGRLLVAGSLGLMVASGGCNEYVGIVKLLAHPLL